MSEECHGSVGFLEIPPAGLASDGRSSGDRSAYRLTAIVLAAASDSLEDPLKGQNVGPGRTTSNRNRRLVRINLQAAGDASAL